MNSLSATAHLSAEWVDGNREPKSPPNPAYPNGIDLDMSRPGRPSCSMALPYPAKRCGHYVVVCSKCNLRIVVTTAGRPDDPKSVRVNCKVAGGLQ